MINIYCTTALGHIYTRKFHRPMARTPNGEITQISVDEIIFYSNSPASKAGEVPDGFASICVGVKTLSINTNHIIAYEKVDAPSKPAASSIELIKS